jgi:hypothetical protein
MKTKEEVEDICRRMENLLETLRNYSGAEIHECRRLMNWFVNQIPNIQAFYKYNMHDEVDEIYEGSLKLIEEAGEFIRKHNLY